MIDLPHNLLQKTNIFTVKSIEIKAFLQVIKYINVFITKCIVCIASYFGKNNNNSIRSSGLHLLILDIKIKENLDVN